LTPFLGLQYSDSKLYDQLLYFDTLFDIEKATVKVAGGAEQGASALLALSRCTGLGSKLTSSLSCRTTPSARRSEPLDD